MYYGNNAAEGQFKEQVWGPVCADPTREQAKAREDVHFDWTKKR
jgi:hypothetical protein